MEIKMTTQQKTAVQNSAVQRGMTVSALTRDMIFSSGKLQLLGINAQLCAKYDQIKQLISKGILCDESCDRIQRTLESAAAELCALCSEAMERQRVASVPIVPLPHDYDPQAAMTARLVLRLSDKETEQLEGLSSAAGLNASDLARTVLFTAKPLIILANSSGIITRFISVYQTLNSLYQNVQTKRYSELLQVADTHFELINDLAAQVTDIQIAQGRGD